MNNQEEKFTQLVREHKSTIYTVCYMFSHDEDEVNDLFQETLINIWKGIDSFREESKVSTWIYRVALNTCLLQERKKKKEVQKVPLSMNVNFFEDEDANSTQVRQLHHSDFSKKGLLLQPRKSSRRHHRWLPRLRELKRSHSCYLA